jgi:hypothetical protein
VIAAGSVFNRYYLPRTGWSKWNDLGRPNGAAAVSVAITARRTGWLYVFAATADGVVWQRTWTSATGFQGWKRISVAPYGFVASVSAATRADETIDLVGRGSDGSVYLRSQAFDGGGWSPWQNMGTPSGGIYKYPAVASGPGVDIVVSADANNHVYRRFWRLTTGWSGWHDEGSLTLYDDWQTLDVAATWKPDNSAFDIYALDEARKVYRKAWSGFFRGWEDLGNSVYPRPNSSAPAATWGYTGRLDVFVRDVVSGQIYWKYWG